MSLKADVKSLMDQLGDARGEALASVAALAQIELVKSRMEAAYDTLKVTAGPGPAKNFRICDRHCLMPHLTLA